MNQLQKANGGLVRAADGFNAFEHAVMTALSLAAMLAALVGVGVALNGDMGSLTQVIRF